MGKTDEKAASETATPAQSSPMNDSLLDMIDQAFAEPGDSTETAAGSETKTPTDQAATDGGKTTQPKKADSAPGKEGRPTPGEKKPDDKATATADGKATGKDSGTGTKAEGKQEEKKEEKGAQEKDPVKKELAAQTAANARLGRELKAAQDTIKVLEAKANGTYKEPAKPSPEEEAKIAEFKGKEAASRKMAFDKYGEEHVKAQIYDEGSPYQELIAKEPWLHARTARSEHPVEEALRILRERQVYTDLGPDPDQWEAKITEKLRPIIMNELKEQLKADGSALVGKTVPGVGEARGAAEGREAVTADEEFTLAGMGAHFLD